MNKLDLLYITLHSLFKEELQNLVIGYTVSECNIKKMMNIIEEIEILKLK
jgi:hypothetical protein